MTEILAFLTATTFILWAEIIFIVLIAILLECEREGWATTIFSLGAALLLFNYRMDIWEVISTNPWHTFGFIGGYILLGITWSIIKWRTLIKPFYDYFEKFKSDYISKNGDDSIKYETDGSDWLKWINHLSVNYKMREHKEFGTKYYFHSHDKPIDIIEEIAPQAKDKKTLLTSWIAYWPASLAATILNDPLRKLFKWIYSLCSGIYDKMSDVFAKNAIKGM